MNSRLLMTLCAAGCFLLSTGAALAQAPTATTGAATGVGATGATVNGTVNANGSSTTVLFEYGLTEEYGLTMPATPSPVSGSTATPVTANLALLDPLTTYHFRVQATNGSGTTYGADMTFTTTGLSGNPPVVITDPATGIGADFATLNGQAHTFDVTTTVIFQWGTDTNYGNAVTADQSPLTSTALAPVTATITGLANNTTYHYRVTASNPNGTTFGQDMTFVIGSGGAAPTATTSAATGIGSMIATLNGTVNANGAATAVTFEYGLDTGYGSTAVASQNPVSGSTATAVDVTLGSFLANTTYHYRVAATNSYGTTYGSDMTFTTLPLAPDATTHSASAVTATGATLNGTVNAQGDSTVVTFEYGLTTSYGSTVAADQSPVTGSTDTAVSKAITGLTNGITYHYRVSATNAGGTTYGADMTFTVGAPPPTATTNAASGIGTTTATFNGTVNPNNSSTTVTFEYGETTAYGRTASAVQSPVTGSTNTSVDATVSDLSPNLTYHYRVKAESAGGTTYGADMTFNTLAAPTVLTNAATAVTTTGATLNGTVNANGDSTTVTFEYGTTTAYGTTVTADQSPVTGNTDTAVNKAITGLTINTTYHYRAVGQNAQGTSYGTDMTFVTSVPGLPVVTTNAASGVMQDAATLNGVVNASNADTTVTFEYGLTAAYGTTVTASPSPVTGSANTAVSVAISGLTVNTLYHYRVLGQNVNGAVNGNDMTFTTTTAPLALTQAATDVTATSATLNGTANANFDSSTGVSFQYDSTPPAPFYSFTAVALPSVISGSSNVPVAASLTGLTPNTTYYYRVYAVNSLPQTTFGGQMTFTTLPGDSAPSAVTNAATAVAATSATINGTVNANSSTTTVTFEYGLDTSYGVTVTASPSPVTGNTPTAVSNGLSSLAPNTTYHYRVKAENTGNTVYGADMTFTTGPLPPAVSTGAATAVFASGATLNGIVNANNDSAAVTFEYGPTSAYGSTATADQSPVSGAANTAVSKAITGLTNNTTYHYRVAAQNTSGTTYGADMTFFTGTAPPTVTTGTASSVGPTSATLNGTVNANNGSTTVTFQLGETIAYGRTETAVQSPVTGSTTTAVSVNATNLSPSTTYHYRTVGQNAGGTVYGADMTFTTNVANSPTVTTANATGITPTSASSGGNVTDEGSAPVTARGVCWSTSTGPTTADSITSDGTGAGAFASTLSGLTPNSDYYVRAYATNLYGTVYGNEVELSTPAAAPIATTNPATAVATTSATLNGTVNARNSSTIVTFEYGLDTSYGTTVAATPSPVTGTTDTAESAPISGLTPNTTYHFRVIGQNPGGTTNGADLTFTTAAAAPTATTLAATAVGTTSATLNGTVNANNSETTVTFEYGLDTSYGTTVTATPSPVTGTANTAVNVPITGLAPNTTYHFRVVGQNTAGTTNGADLSFTTVAAPPAATTDPATGISIGGATLNGTINANNESTTVIFEYGLDTSYGTTVTGTPSTVAGTTDTVVSAPISGLTPDTFYHFRVVAQNGTGTTNGADLTFATSIPNPPTVTTANVSATTGVSAMGGGNVTDEGDAPVTARGVCWSTSPNPTIADDTTSDGSGAGAFSSNLTGLTPGTTYYVRAYATSSFGTAYGDDVQFASATPVPSLSEWGMIILSLLTASSGLWIIRRRALVNVAHDSFCDLHRRPGRCPHSPG